MASFFNKKKLIEWESESDWDEDMLEDDDDSVAGETGRTVENISDDEDDDCDEDDDSDEVIDDDVDDEVVDENVNDDYDTDEDEDMDDEEYLSMDEDMSEEEYKAYIRRKRRVRNQIIAYIVTAIILMVVISLTVFGVKKVVDIIKAHHETKVLEQEIEALDAMSSGDIVIEAPEGIMEETEEVEEEVATEDYENSLLDAYIVDLPIETKVAQLFIVTPEALTNVDVAVRAGDGTKEALEKYPVGGFIYFAQNIEDKEQLMEMLQNTKEYESLYPPFLCVDEEGGTVSRVAKSSIDVPVVDSMYQIGEAGDTTKAYEAGKTIGTYLEELGFNVDFAPVADVVSNIESSSIGDRSFGDNPETVGDMVANAVTGIQETNVSACLKHFPGLDDASEDTHDGKVILNKTLDEMRESDFVSFKKGIEAGVKFVMVGHGTAINADESGMPASLSSMMVTSVLRNELGFEGIVITDAMNMGAITTMEFEENACVMALKAGVDMILMPENFEEAYQAVLAAVDSGSITEERIDESLRRIYKVKHAGEIENYLSK